ncbi:MAG: nitrous oxide reductase accessory protein NosL [Burkholderiaceae bacterium]|nr:nitrous oxide reductase accessory protein NosL [Burkholderiaceae bacterium]
MGTASPPCPRLRRRLLLGTAAGLGTVLAGGLLARAGVAAASRRAVPALPDEVCILAPPTPFDPASGLSPLAARPVPAEARCPVCGMFAARHPLWAAMAVFDDGAAQFFDTPAHLFLYLQAVPRYQRGRSLQQLRALFASDHRGGGWLPLQQAVFVQGSRALGPMRTEDLPAFADAGAAAAFIAEAGGTPVRAEALRLALPEGLQRQAPHRHL